MNKINKVFLGILTFLLVSFGVVFATNSIRLLSDDIDVGDIITADWYKAVNNFVNVGTDEEPTHSQGGTCSYDAASGAILCVSDGGGSGSGIFIEGTGNSIYYTGTGTNPDPDSGTGKVGIGTMKPLHTLHVVNNNEDDIFTGYFVGNNKQNSYLLQENATKESNKISGVVARLSEKTIDIGGGLTKQPTIGITVSSNAGRLATNTNLLQFAVGNQGADLKQDPVMTLDNNGNLWVKGTVTASGVITSGGSSTAASSITPTECGSGSYINKVNADGTFECGAVGGADSGGGTCTNTIKIGYLVTEEGTDWVNGGYDSKDESCNSAKVEFVCPKIGDIDLNCTDFRPGSGLKYQKRKVTCEYEKKDVCIKN